MSADEPLPLAEPSRERLERYAAHLPEGDDLALITLKGHLLVEEVLLSIIKIHCRSPEVLDGVRFDFAAKLQVARALSQADIGARAWSAAQALNSLRNVLSHNLDSSEERKRLDRLFAIVRDSSDASRAYFGEHAGNDPELLKTSVAFVLAGLAIFEAYSRSYQAAVGALITTAEKF